MTLAHGQGRPINLAGRQQFLPGGWWRTLPARGRPFPGEPDLRVGSTPRGAANLAGRVPG